MRTPVNAKNTKPAGCLNRVRSFLDCEAGAATIWNLTWFLGFGIMAGLSIDTTNARRMQTIMQSTADAAALAAVYDVEVEETAREFAETYVANNMPEATYGEVLLQDEDIRFGAWSLEDRIFDPESATVNAVQVTLRRTRAADNEMGTTLLKLIGMDGWDINVTSVAALKWERCYLDGIISASEVVMESSNIYGDNYCVYGRFGITVVNGNDFTGENTHAYAGYSTAATYPCGFNLQGRQGSAPHCNKESNPGLEDAEFVSDDIHPTRVIELDEDGNPVYGEDGNYISTVGVTVDWIVSMTREMAHLGAAEWGGGSSQPSPEVTQLLMAGGKYYLECNRDRDVLQLRQGDYRNLTLATNCLLELPGGSPTNPPIYENVVFASTSTASFGGGGGTWGSLEHNIAIRGGNQLGTGCGAETGATFWTESGIKLDGGNIHMGSEFNAGGDVGIDGDNDAGSTAVHFTTIHALGDITMTSNSQYRLCNPDGDAIDIIKKPILVY